MTGPKRSNGQRLGYERAMRRGDEARAVEALSGLMHPAESARRDDDGEPAVRVWSNLPPSNKPRGKRSVLASRRKVTVFP